LSTEHLKNILKVAFTGYIGDSQTFEKPLDTQNSCHSVISVLNWDAVLCAVDRFLAVYHFSSWDLTDQ
jgi:hypothetical protein